MIKTEPDGPFARPCPSSLPPSRSVALKPWIPENNTDMTQFLDPAIGSLTNEARERKERPSIYFRLCLDLFSSSSSYLDDQPHWFRDMGTGRETQYHACNCSFNCTLMTLAFHLSIVHQHTFQCIQSYYVVPRPPLSLASSTVGWRRYMLKSPRLADSVRSTFELTAANCRRKQKKKRVKMKKRERRQRGHLNFFFLISEVHTPTLFFSLGHFPNHDILGQKENHQACICGSCTSKLNWKRDGTFLLVVASTSRPRGGRGVKGRVLKRHELNAL